MHSAVHSRVAVLLLCALGLVALASGQSVWGTRTNVAPKGGTWSTNLASYDINCPGDSFVTGFTVVEDLTSLLDEAGKDKYDWTVPSLWPLHCSNGVQVRGTASTRPVLKSSTYTIGAWNGDAIRRSIGYDGIKVHHSKLVGSVFFTPVTPAQTPVGYGRYPEYRDGSSKTTEVACPAGQVITGIYGQASETHMVTVGLHCRSYRHA